KRGDLIAGSFDGGAGTLADGVNGRSVTEFCGEIGKHRVEDLGFDGRCGVEVEVDAIHGAISRVGRLREGVNSVPCQEGKKTFASEAQNPQRAEEYRKEN